MLARTGVPVLPGQRRAACPLSTRQAPLRTAQLICRAAAEDPYTVLGIKPDADQNEINRAYTRKKAENRGNEAVKRKIEAAHSALMLSAFNARLKGARGVSKDIKYADEPPLFPWRPKRWDATPQVAMVIGAMQLGLATFGFQSPAMSKIIACMALGVVGNVMKQNAINPGPSDPEMIDENSNRATNNFVRGVLLAIMATFFAIGVGSLPEIATKYVTIPLFKQQPQLIVAIKIAVAALSNWIMTAFYY